MKKLALTILTLVLLGNAAAAYSSYVYPAWTKKFPQLYDTHYGVSNSKGYDERHDGGGRSSHGGRDSGRDSGGKSGGGGGGGSDRGDRGDHDHGGHGGHGRD